MRQKKTKELQELKYLHCMWNHLFILVELQCHVLIVNNLKLENKVQN